MGLFKKRATEPNEVERLRHEITSMAARLDEADAAKQRLGEQVHGIVQRLDTPLTPPPAAPPVAEPPVDPDAFRALLGRVHDLAARLEGLDARITSVSTELANQIAELSSDLDGVGDADIAGLTEQLHDAQVKLAAEQARYQIAFRQDLAQLADQLKRA
ncbi:MAG TPA: hypothetical protein VIS05_05400 [Ilumatobacter sp.]